tara:strand:+ start:4079 stop:4186 length:108 start_codon:yes stop_codon:yes gene_type:complete
MEQTMTNQFAFIDTTGDAGTAFVGGVVREREIQQA